MGLEEALAIIKTKYPDQYIGGYFMHDNDFIFVMAPDRESFEELFAVAFCRVKKDRNTEFVDVKSSLFFGVNPELGQAFENGFTEI